MDASNRRRHFVVALSAVAILAVITALVLEATLQIAARVFPQAEAVLFPNRPIEAFVADPELAIRGNPLYSEHDANGFRNASIPATADIVAIGDSHTYGWGVASQETWVRILERRTSCRIYSMAFGGYGPLQYAILAQKAVLLRPRLIVVGIYFGNDFSDNWEMYRRDPSKYPVPKDLQNAAMEREARNAFSREVPDFFAAGKTDSKIEPPWSLHYFMSQNSGLWGFARAVKNRLSSPAQESSISLDFRESVAALTPIQLEFSSIFEGTDWRTILTSRYRHVAENDRDPRVLVGLWLTKWAAQNIDRLAKRNGIDTLFVLLPTKESAFVNKVHRPAEQKSFEELTSEEDRLRRNLIQSMDEEHLAYVDLAPALRAAAQQPYPESADGHPNAAGHKLIAEELLDRVGVCKH